jgi:DNA-binding transcriptional MerR regulator
MFTVGEMSKLTGLTVRALHHYDEIGLVRPSSRSAAGYRLYDDGDVRRLHDVMVFRELGIPLDDISAVIADPTRRDDVLRTQREVLVTKRARLDQMIAAVDRMTKGTTMSDDMKSMFDGFDAAAHEQEAEQRWGTTDAFKESKRRTQTYGKSEWDEIKREVDVIYRRLVDLMREGAVASDPRVRAAVDDHRAHISRWFYPCTTEIHRGLGEMYVADPRFTANLDAYAPGFARFLRDAFCA